MRKSEVKAQLDESQRKVTEVRAVLASMVHQHDLIVKAGQEQRKLLAEMAEEVRIYSWAFSIASGRLAAYQDEMTPEEYRKALLIEAQKELESLG
jgi:hypothetical protein